MRFREFVTLYFQGFSEKTAKKYLLDRDGKNQSFQNGQQSSV